MHPVEHIIYFSVALLFWIVPSHPLMVIFILQHAVLVANTGHSGFEDYVVKGKAKLPTGQFIHYQHHRYFECNYGSPNGAVRQVVRHPSRRYAGSARAHVGEVGQESGLDG